MLQCIAENAIDDIEEGRKEEDSNDHHRGRSLHLGAGRSDYLAHLAAHVLQEVAGPRKEPRHLVYQPVLLCARTLSARHHHRLRHMDPSQEDALSRSVFARAMELARFTT